MKWMRPRFTLANLLLFTAIVAMGAQMYRHHIQFQELEVELALHKKLRAQVHRVRQRELELQATMAQLKPRLETARMYRRVGFAHQLPVNATDSPNAWLRELEFTTAIGTRRPAAQVRHAELLLVRERNLLQALEHDLSQRFGN